MSGKYKTNGCGPEKVIRIFGKEIKPPYHIFFEASCDKHDEYYNKGGREIDRKIADWLFLFYIRQDVYRLRFYKIPYFFILTYIYYFAVRLGGAKHFNYRL